MAAGSTVPTGHQGSNDAPASGGPGSGVSQIIPGVGVTITPLGGTGNVVINAGIDATARASAAAAQATATSAAGTAAGAAASAAAAQATATGAVTDAATAQAAATAAAAAAAAAQATGDGAAIDAATALGLANSAANLANFAITLAELVRYYSDDLPNNDATIDIAAGTVKWTTGGTITPSAPWTYTLGTAGALNRSELILFRTPAAAFPITIINGGPGAGTLLVWPNSFTRQKAVFLFDGTDWFLDRQSLLQP